MIFNWIIGLYIIKIENGYDARSACKTVFNGITN